MPRAGNCDGWPASKQFYYLNVKRASCISQARDMAPLAKLETTLRAGRCLCVIAHRPAKFPSR